MEGDGKEKADTHSHINTLIDQLVCVSVCVCALKIYK